MVVDQKLPLRRLQTPWEQNDQVPLEEDYISDVANPRKNKFQNKPKCDVELESNLIIDMNYT